MKTTDIRIFHDDVINSKWRVKVENWLFEDKNCFGIRGCIDLLSKKPNINFKKILQQKVPCGRHWR